MRYLTFFSTALLAAAVVGCGGGGNELGPADDIQLSIQSVTATGAVVGHCAVGVGPTVHVYGGLPPYRLYNSLPMQMSLDKQVVQNSGEGFTLTFLGGCMENMAITVTDETGKIATFSVTNLEKQQ